MSPADPAAWRRERRHAARAAHPDLGGDPEVYLALLAEVDARHGITPAAGHSTSRTVVTVRLTRRRRLLRRLRRLRRHS